MANLSRLLTLGTLLTLLLLQLIVNFCSTANDVYYQLPNPFTTSTSFYSIGSIQTTISSDGKKSQLKLEEFFSLEEGLTYSLHENRDDSREKYAIIGDGPRGRSYIVRNPDSSGNLDCELDHLHHHRQVFPWQYVFDIANNDGSKKKKKNKKKGDKWAKKRFIYGVGAIWLNAIERKIVSNQIGSESIYPGANLWLLRDGDLEVKLIFEKPEESKDEEEMRKRLANSKIDSIEVKRQKIIQNDDIIGGNSLVDAQRSIIRVKRFEKSIEEDTKTRFFYQLAVCREATKLHRLFPSAIRALSLSPKRALAIDYIAKKYPRLRDLTSGSFDTKRHRNVYDIEMRRELFSFPRETQVNVYQGLLPELQSRADVFIRKFTENAKDRSSRHSSVHYHIIEMDGEPNSCLLGENDPKPIEGDYMIRPVHFHHNQDVQLIGHLTGLLALLMNAVDIHHKEFSLFKTAVNVYDEPWNLELKTKMKVDEWRFFDKKTSRTIHFYFLERTNEFEQHQIGDLIRIDIRDKVSEIDLDNPANEGIENEVDDNDSSLVESFHILALYDDAEEEELNFMLTPPEDLCNKSKKPDEEEDSDDDSDDEGDYYHDDDYYNNYNSDDEDSEHDENDQENQDEGEEFEFEPGKLIEHTNFPDFFEFIDGRQAYEIVSKIEILPEIGEDGSIGAGKSIYFRENVDLKAELALYSIYHSELNLRADKPDREFYINYNSELVYYIGQKKDELKCSIENKVDSWMRLFSTKMSYYRKIASSDSASQETTMIKSNKYRLYGVGALWRAASESEFVDFTGMRKEPILSDGSQYREVIWSINDEADFDMSIDFKFIWNESENEKNKAKKKKGKRAIDLLYLQSIYTTELVTYETKSEFKDFKLTVISMKYSNGDHLLLPEKCLGVFVPPDDSYDVRTLYAPSFFDFVQKTNKYSVKYTVGHNDYKLPKSGDKLVTDGVLVSESYDRAEDRGKISIGTGADQREIYILGKDKKMFLFQNKNRACKPIKSVASLVDYGSYVKTTNPMFRLDTMYGLAAIWIDLTAKKNLGFSLDYRIDEKGKRHQKRTYRLSRDTSTSSTWDGVYSIEMVFLASPKFVQDNSSPGGSKTKVEDEVLLESIRFKPNLHSMAKENIVHPTLITVQSISPEITEEWQLPKECSDQPISSEKFPKFSQLISTTKQFHMRSEIIISSKNPGTSKRVFMMDEWLYNRRVRMKTYSLYQNLDLLIYGDTGERFDLSREFKCSTDLPNFYPSKSPNKIVEFWANQATIIDQLCHIYYGPMSLWKLADGNGVKIELVTQIDIAPKPIPNTSSDKLENEMSLETWKVSHPKSPAYGTWSYEMTFRKMPTHYILESITVMDNDETNSKRYVNIDTINYRYGHSTQELMDKFLVPEGYGCARNVLNEDEIDEFTLDLNLPYILTYEASLETVRNLAGSTLQVRTMMPTVTGTVVKDHRFNLAAHYNRVRQLSGITMSSKVVYESDKSLRYNIDLLTGACEVGTTTKESLNLEFATLTVFEQIQLDRILDELFGKSSTANFKLLNKYVDNGQFVAAYESSFTDFKINDNLTGPVSIVKTFRDPRKNSTPLKTKAGLKKKIFDTVSIEIKLFDSGRTTTKAIFNLILRKFELANTDVIHYTNIASCYENVLIESDRGIKSFALDYQLDGQDLKQWAKNHIFNLEGQFISILLDSMISPIQIVGTPVIDFSHNQMTVHFNLLEGPTASEYYKRLAESRMTESIESKSNFKIVSSPYACSRWCDQLDCYAMSYCADRTCRVATLNMLKDDQVKGDIPLQTDQDCTLYLKSSKLWRSLNSFKESTEFDVNAGREGNKLSRFAISLSRASVVPVRFVEHKRSLDWKTKDLKNVENEDRIAFTSPKSNLKLDGSKLDVKKSDLRPVYEHVQSYSECATLCKQFNCFIMSHCKDKGYCTILTGKSDLKMIMDSFIMPAPCTITARDFLVDFTRFEDTQMPTTYKTKLEGYSAQECGSMCLTNNQDHNQEFNCLSFDICSPRITGGSPKLSSGNLCFLQTSHIMTDSFDRSILAPKWHELKQTDKDKENIENFKCEHYSRSVIADYRRNPNKRISTKSGSVLRGLDAERCAIECQSVDDCIAFEFCSDDKNHPPQSCHLVIRDDNTSDKSGRPNLLSNLNKELDDSERCSVYTVSHNKEQFLQDNEGGFIPTAVKVFKRHNHILRKFLLGLSYVVGFLIIGSLIQLVYIRLIGRSIIFSN